MSASIEERALAIIAEFTGHPTERINPEDELSQLGLDSLDSVDVSLSLEQEFGIKIDDDDLPKLKTVKEIIDYIEEKV